MWHMFTNFNSCIFLSVYSLWLLSVKFSVTPTVHFRASDYAQSGRIYALEAEITSWNGRLSVKFTPWNLHLRVKKLLHILFWEWQQNVMWQWSLRTLAWSAWNNKLMLTCFQNPRILSVHFQRWQRAKDSSKLQYTWASLIGLLIGWISR
jgi:hypothetical protein